ncbi:MAG: hypothetical protein CVT94_16440 [Bacteroidetes bacterium HGW-Bacteroidetes-11]|nr:MAG: hypothetical protein CVT94_16440 [Bacteroidetes bacterium HGW-Bacteroidetes-11]
MSDFEKKIKEKADDELLKILICSQDYQPEFVKLAKREFEEVRGKFYEDFIRVKTDEELADYYIHSTDFQTNFIELVKKELTENRHISLDSFKQKQTVYNNDLKKKRDGWLSFFLFVVGLGGVLSPIIGFSKMSLSNYDLGIGHWFSVLGAVSDGILLLGIAFLAFYTIKSFNNYKSNAVGLGKSFLIIVFITNLFSLIGGNYELSGFYSLSQIIIRLIWQVIWFIYLSQSKLVEVLFPKEERKLLKRDKILLFSMITPVIIWTISIFVFSFGQSFTNQTKVQQDTINEIYLTSNEYTDGRIIFEKPAVLVVEKLIEENETFYKLTQDDDVSMTIYSTFDNTDTKEYFEECMRLWADESFEDFEFITKKEQNYFHNKNSIYLKTVQYKSEPIIQWTFVILFNTETSKCCVLSCYSINEAEFLSDLINSIRFK